MERIFFVEQIFKEAIEREASDVYLSEGKRVCFRIQGKVVMDPRYIPCTQISDWLKEVCEDSLRREFERVGEIDFAIQRNRMPRMRIHVFRQMNSIGISVRIIQDRLPSLEQLRIPQAILHRILERRGLFLVTGPTGSGKSTTLAALIHYLNQTETMNILTLEDPIEYVHDSCQSLIIQREIGRDTKTFATGLHSALRLTPDVIMIGEMRDRKTISTVLTAAQTGHLVLSTLHTPNTSQAIERVIHVFPSDEQNQIRSGLANCLIGITAQCLFSSTQQRGRVAAFEVLFNTFPVANLIRQGKIHQIYSILETSSKDGMVTLEQSIRLLNEQGHILQSKGG